MNKEAWKQRMIRWRNKLLPRKSWIIPLAFVVVFLIIITPWNQGASKEAGASVSSMPPLASMQQTQKITQMPVQSILPSPTPYLKQEEKPLLNRVIGLDPGHQEKGDSKLEPVAPGSSTLKKKVSSGTQGRWSHVPEYEVNLAVALLLKDLLEDAGATVVMTREKADVNISNIQRAQIFNKANVDLGLRLHCNGADDKSDNGAFMLVPKSNPHMEHCVSAAQTILKAYGKATGISVERGLSYRGDQTGFNWCSRPVINIEMGYMTNKEDDARITDPAFQKKMAQGLYNGILEFYIHKEE
ncbi:MAG: N-acetylmuramoyl-L-alanine amidase family protein [Christensenellales bacterium]